MQIGSSILISNGTMTPAVIENGPGVISLVAINLPSSIELSIPMSSSHTFELRRMSVAINVDLLGPVTPGSGLGVV